jgi:hypothetical protein
MVTLTAKLVLLAVGVVENVYDAPLDTCVGVIGVPDADDVTTKSAAVPSVLPAAFFTVTVQVMAVPARGGVDVVQARLECVVGTPYTMNAASDPVRALVVPCLVVSANDVVVVACVEPNVNVDPPSAVLRTIVVAGTDDTVKSVEMPVVAPRAFFTVIVHVTATLTRAGK